ncbi:MAG TPA: hypothetical protein DDY14_02475 [Chromatiaceae bacterium]|nr:MAG: hypothetical protein N838_01950 [Thiohalocapsa sp. PB-PSB1]HBG94195.1 hypothetical protein [Chromatiaceae bacterium]HCS91152.1 hypothetical protein [Chromatiaceae bacterium]
MYDFLGYQWLDYKRRLHRICILTHAEALLNAICNDLGGPAPPELVQTVETWISRHVGRDLEQRIRGAGSDGQIAANSPWAQVLRLFHSPTKMAQQIHRSRDAICGAWRLGEDDRARSILWSCLSHYFYEAKFEVDGPTGQHRLRNWARIRRLLQKVQQNWEQQAAGLAGAERDWALRRLDDPAWLAAAILAESQSPDARYRLDDVRSIDGVLAYLYAFLPQLNIGDMENDPALAEQLPSDLQETIDYYIDDPASPAGLSPQERAALILEYREGISPMSDGVFQQTYGHTRQTHRNRVGAGVRKIAPWVRRDLES